MKNAHKLNESVDEIIDDHCIVEVCVAVPVIEVICCLFASIDPLRLKPVNAPEHQILRFP